MHNYTFQIFNSIFELQIIDTIEWQPQRMLHQVTLSHNGKDVTAQYFGTWNYLNFNLDNYQGLSPDKKYLYIPKEGDHFVINTETLEKIELPEIPLSTLYFEGNSFIGDSLVILSYRQILVYNFLTRTVKMYEMDF